MKQIFSHYQNWEDFQNGMFQIVDIKNKHKKVFNAVLVLTSPEIFYNGCKKLLEEWTIASNVNLTNLNQNRRAWLGAAACCYLYQVPEVLTRIAWNLLSKEEQDLANSIADKIIKEFENNLKDNNYVETLFTN